MKGGDFADRGVAPRPAGEDDRIYSGSDPELHHGFDRASTPVVSEVVAAALASGTLLVGGRVELRGRLLRREARP